MKSQYTEWKKVKLGDILHYLDERISLDDEKEYLTITVKRRQGGLEIREKLFGHQIATKKQFRLTPGSFIISRVQCWHQAYAMVGDVPSNAIASTNYDQFAISPEVNPRFFWWLSHSPTFTATVRSCAVGVVIEKMVFNRDEWLTKSVRLPSSGEQKRIVARIEELAAQINEARSLRQQAAEEGGLLARAKARAYISELKTAPSKLSEWLDKSRDGIQTGPFGAQLSSTEFTDSGVPIITIGNVRYSGLDCSNVRYVSREKASTLARYRLSEGDILFARMGTVGRCCVVPPRSAGWLINYHIIRVALDKSKVEPRFIHWLIQASHDIETYLENKIRGATRAGVNSTIVANLPCRIPVLAEQRRIVAELDGMQAKVDELKKLQAETAIELDALLPSILDKAFKGELT